MNYSYYVTIISDYVCVHTCGSSLSGLQVFTLGEAILKEPMLMESHLHLELMWMMNALTWRYYSREFLLSTEEQHESPLLGWSSIALFSWSPCRDSYQGSPECGEKLGIQTHLPVLLFHLQTH